MFSDYSLKAALDGVLLSQPRLETDRQTGRQTDRQADSAYSPVVILRGFIARARARVRARGQKAILELVVAYSVSALVCFGISLHFDLFLLWK